MVKISTIISLIIFVFLSCIQNPQKKIDNYKSKKICYEVDSLLYDSVPIKRCLTYGEDGELVREGYYMQSNIAVGFHKFYKNKKVSKIREYLYNGEDSSYLNNIYAFYSNGDTNYLSSNFGTVKIKNEKLDSFNVEVSLDAPYWKDSEYDVLIKDFANPKEILVFNSYEKKILITLPSSIDRFSVAIREFIIKNEKILERYYFYKDVKNK